MNGDDDALHRYVAWLQTLDRAALVDNVAYYAPGVHFRDPFNDLHGREALVAVLQDMFGKVGDLRFVVHAYGWCRDAGSEGDGGRTALLRWTLHGRLHALRGRAWVVDGCSEVRFDRAGQVTAHLDYWDAAAGLYAQLPLVGPVMRWLARRLAVSPPP